MTTIQAILLAVVEGLTEYLPISSTGHIILTSSLMGIADQEFTKDFTVMVQFGAILSVLAIYWRRFFNSIEFYVQLLIGVLPAIVIGFLIKDWINSVLGSVAVVAASLFLGGIILLFIERMTPRAHLKNIDQLTRRHALIIGLAQCIAFIPGVSRAAASIIGGLFIGMDRKTAAEFSFFLAVPTLTAATALKAVKIIPTVTGEQIQLLLIGNVVAFIVGYIAIKGFIGLISRFSFVPFGWYRIILGVVVWLFLVRQ